MIPTRESPATDSNILLTKTDAGAAPSNLAWFRAGRRRRGIVLLGGTSLADFRLRFAQSGLRDDLSPSYWSLCGLLVDTEGRFLSVPLQPADVSSVARDNAVQECSLTDFDDPEGWPNIAVLSFTREPEAVVRQARLLGRRRSIIDLPELVLAWLGYAWGVGAAGNPLQSGHGIPSAAYVEAAHALAGVELTPGLSSASSCPEAIWQAVKWWHDYYRETAEVTGGPKSQTIVPRGRYLVRQRSAQLSPPDGPPSTDPRRPGRRAKRGTTRART